MQQYSSSLSGKVAVITGASHGLGKAVTELLSEQGVKVFALARSIEKTDLPDSVVKVSLNIRDLQSLDAAFAQIDEQTQTIDILVNCAGRGLSKPFEATTREEMMDVFGVNLKGNMYVALEVYKRMIPTRSGHILNIGSTSSLKARELEVVYCASKWGLRGFTESLRLEARKYGIKVTGIYPGGMKSANFWKIAPERDIHEYMDPEHIAEQILHILSANPGIAPAELVIERP